MKAGHGWVLKDDKLEPLWYTADVLPQQLIDIADDALVSDDVDSDDSDEDYLYQLADNPDQFSGQSSDESSDSDTN